MARYPATLLPWVTEDYGPDADAWNEAKRQARTVLHEWASAGRFGSYSELAKRVTAIPWPEGAYTHRGRQMGRLLGQVSLEELDRTEDRPLLSALVIGQEEGMPSGGFWSLLAEIGLTVLRPSSSAWCTGARNSRLPATSTAHEIPGFDHQGLRVRRRENPPWHQRCRV